MQIQPLSAVLPHTLVHVTIQLSKQTQQQANNFMYKSRPAEFKGAGHIYICKCLQDQDPRYCMEFGLAFCFPVGFDLLFLNSTVIGAF